MYNGLFIYAVNGVKVGLDAISVHESQLHSILFYKQAKSFRKPHTRSMDPWLQALIEDSACGCIGADPRSG